MPPLLNLLVIECHYVDMSLCCYSVLFTIYLLFTIKFIYLFFTDLFTERACPQQAKANLGKRKNIQTKIN